MSSLNRNNCSPYLPALKPVVYKDPSPHPHFLKKEVNETLANLPQPLCSMISGYAENACSMLECTNGDIITVDLPNYAHKKVIATLKCSQKYKRAPLHIQIACGLINDAQISASLKEELQKKVNAYKQKEKEQCQ